MTPAPPPKNPEFERKVAEWLRRLECKAPSGGLDPHSILSQLYALARRTGAYRVVNEARRLAPTDARGKPMGCDLIHDLMNHGYYASQLLGIRRLLDKQGVTGKRGVFSLRNLVDDMKEHRHLFTRRNVFAQQEQSMDVEALRTQEREMCWQSATAPGQQGEAIYGPSLDRAEALHRDFDRLSGVSPDQRKEDDVISEGVFDRLSRMLDGLDHFRRHADQYLAHASTPESREAASTETGPFTYREAWEANRTLARVCVFIDLYLLRGREHSFLPIDWPDPTKHADQPLVPSERMDELRAQWSRYAEEVDEWRRISLDWLFDACAGGGATDDQR